jgi:hypothetical protein
MTLIPIDRDSIQRNERAGQSTSYVCGPKKPISLSLGWRSLPENTERIILFLVDLIEKDGGFVPRRQVETYGGKIDAVLGTDVTEGQAVDFCKRLPELLRPFGGFLNTDECGLALPTRLEPVYHYPIPPYSYKHAPTDVTCSTCGKTFKHAELKSDSYYDGEDDIYSNTICPVCGAWGCCEVEFERINREMAEEVLKTREEQKAL